MVCKATEKVKKKEKRNSDSLKLESPRIIRKPRSEHSESIKSHRYFPNEQSESCKFYLFREDTILFFGRRESHVAIFHRRLPRKRVTSDRDDKES